MDWMLVALEAEVESFSSSETQSLHLHLFSLCRTLDAPAHLRWKPRSGLSQRDGTGWICILVNDFWILHIILRNDGTMVWEDCALTCCLGSGFGCGCLPVEAKPGS